MQKTKSHEPTPRELLFVEAKVKGLSNTKAAMVANPDLKPSSAKNAGHTLATNQNVQALLAKALKKHHITIDRAIKPIDKALDADKVVITGKGEEAFAELIPDYSLQMQASDRALKLLGITDKPKATEPEGNNDLSPALAEALKAGNVKELQRIIFNDPSSSAEQVLTD